LLIDANTIYIPKKLIEEIKEKGLDIIDIIANALVNKVDPKVVIEARIEVAEKSLEEARQYLEKGNSIQASEKLYKAVEECIKALAQYYNTPDYQAASREGRWWAQLLGKAARRLARMLNEPRIESAWAVAYEVHVWGFHEAKYDVEDIKDDIKYAEWLLNYTKQVVKEAKQ